MKKCPNPNTALYKTLKKMNPYENQGALYYMYEVVSDLQDRGLISDRKFTTNISGKDYYKINKVANENTLLNKNSSYGKDLKTYQALKKELEERKIDWIHVKETKDAYLISFTSPKMDFILDESEQFEFTEEDIKQLTDDELSNQMLKEQEEAEDKERKIVKPAVQSFIKPGVSELFESNSELADIGTQEQYSQYLDTIFPDSKVKDIVYHGTNNYGFENFSKDKLGDKTNSPSAKLGFFFASSLENSDEYLKKEDFSNRYHNYVNSATSGNDAVEAINFIEKLLNSYKGSITLKEEITKEHPSQLDIASGLFDEGDIFEDRKLIIVNDESEGYDSYQLEKAFGTIVQDSGFQDISNYYKKGVFNLSKLNRLATLVNKSGTNIVKGDTYSVILDIKNSKKFDDNFDERLDTYANRINQALEEKKDSAIIKNTKDPLNTDVFVVFEPEQIHILGSKQDIEGFKEFVNEKSLSKKFDNKFPNYTQLELFEKEAIENSEDDLDIFCSL